MSFVCKIFLVIDSFLRLHYQVILEVLFILSQILFPDGANRFWFLLFIKASTRFLWYCKFLLLMKNLHKFLVSWDKELTVKIKISSSHAMIFIDLINIIMPLGSRRLLQI